MGVVFHGVIESLRLGKSICIFIGIVMERYISVLLLKNRNINKLPQKSVLLNANVDSRVKANKFFANSFSLVKLPEIRKNNRKLIMLAQTLAQTLRRRGFLRLFLFRENSS